MFEPIIISMLFFKYHYRSRYDDFKEFLVQVAPLDLLSNCKRVQKSRRQSPPVGQLVHPEKGVDADVHAGVELRRGVARE